MLARMAETSLVKGLPSVGHQTLVSLVLAGAIKPFVEMGISMTPVGNTTVVSGLVKVALGVGAHLVGASKVPIAGDAIVAALIVDGGEDLSRGIATGAIWGPPAQAASASNGGAW
jgi:hypothetical protein